jgi:hypothetical protein
MAFQLNFLSFLKIHVIFHVSLLEPSHISTNLGRIHDPSPRIEVKGEHEYEVENILNSRISNCGLQYIVHWHGYDVSEHTWELMNNLSNAM